MARIALGALTTLNLSTHLDPMFIELYAAQAGNFSGATTFTYGNGTGSRNLVINGGATNATDGGKLTFQRNGANGFIVGDAGGVLGSGAGDGVLLTNGATNIRFWTNGAERMRVDASGQMGIGVTPTCKLDVFGNFLQVRDATYTGYFGRATDLVSGGAATDLGIFSGTGNILLATGAGVERLRIGAGPVTPGGDNTQTLGAVAKRWSVVYAGTGAINTSDAREKTAVAPLMTSEIAAAKDLAREIGAFQFLDAVKAKGEGARLHIGMTVQRAIEIMQGHGLEAERYGFICYDEWEAEGDTPAGSRYGFRVDELLLFLARGFEARLSTLEAA
jgi:hypothetical protein